jgi:alkanesulfonate monooxygenase
MPKQLHLGAIMRPVAIHTAWWRYPGAYPDANFNLKHLVRFIRSLEQAKFDAFFMADHLAVLNMPVQALRRSATVTSFEPLTLLSALAMVTERIGLIATASTTFDRPHHVARGFASLDNLSNGRAGWNVVTTANPDAALNFGLTDHVEHDERYRRAREFHAIVTGLWASWADAARRYEPSDLNETHDVGHAGQDLAETVPLNIARPVQSRPVIVQAGASEVGRQFAAETAEVVFGSSRTEREAQEFYKDVKARVIAARRSADHCRILPGAMVIVGKSREEARNKKALLDSLVHSDSGIPNLSIRLGIDVSTFDLDASLPEIPPSNQSQSQRDTLVALARRDNLTVRQLAQMMGGFGGLEIVGTADEIADTMQSWLESGAADGFNIMFPTVPAGLDDFVDLVIPELRRRGIFRDDYEGTTLREHFGLPRPECLFAPPS